MVKAPASWPDFCALTQTQQNQWAYTWGDEFEGSGPVDPGKWSLDVGAGGWDNNEAEYYTKRPENIRRENGVLVIEARKEEYKGSHYTSARITSKHTQMQGRVDLRAKFPTGVGTWPAGWFLPIKQIHGTKYWPDNGEIDLLEGVGFTPNTNYTTLHTLANNASGKGDSVQVSVLRSATEFHLYTMEWFPARLDFYVDGKLIMSYPKQPNADWTTYPFDQPFFMILNLAVGGNWGGEKGIDDSAFPTRFEIDYVRFYRSAANTSCIGWPL